VIVVKSVIKRFSAAVLIVGLLVASQAPIASAASNYWTNGGDGVYWTDANNWSLLRAPLVNDVLVFDSATSNTSEGMEIYNNLNYLRLNGLTFTGSSANGYYLYGGTLEVNGEIRDQNTGASLNYIENNVLARGTVKVSAVNNAWLFNFGKYTMGNYPLYFRTFHNAANYFDGIALGANSVYVVGDNSGSTIFGTESQVLRPTVVRDKGKLWLGGGVMHNLHIATSGYMHVDSCVATKNLRIEGYHYAYIDGTPACANYGRINAVGTVNITNGKLAFTNDALGDGYIPVIGAKYVLVSNDGSDKVIGKYKNRPEGSVFKIEGRSFKITYKGGTGNDIVITRL
jgi:hypothetical protein